MDVGVDTPKRIHVLVAIDADGRTRGGLAVANPPEGWGTALRWARALPPHVRWGVEQSGALGTGFAQFLLAQGAAAVREVVPPRPAQERRRRRPQDKTAAAAALAMARRRRAEGELLPAVQAAGGGTALRLRSDHRDHRVVDRTRLTNQRHAHMRQLDPASAARSGPLPRAAGGRSCQQLAVPEAEAGARTRRLVVRQLAARILQLDADIAEVTEALERRVQARGTPLLPGRGVGPGVAARLRGEVGGVPRVRAAAAVAALAGIAPLTVASGGRKGPRGNPGGNRTLNRAIPIVALTQRRREPLAQASDEKKRAAGKTARAAMRCRKRRLVDVLVRHLQPACQAPPAPAMAVAA